MIKVLYRFEFTNYSARQFKNLSPDIQKRIKDKLLFLSHQQNIFDFAKPMHFALASHRFRVGDYRIIVRLEKDSKTFVIVKVGHRKDVYK